MKVKWLNASFGIPLSTLADRMRKLKFDASLEDADGFRIQERATSFVHGQWIEKESFLELISLPTGETYEETRSNFNIVDFYINPDASLGIELVDPPRKIGSFLNSLSEITKQEFVCRVPEVDVLKWVAEIEELYGETIVTSLDCNGVQLSSSVIGRFAFRGNSDVRSEYRRTLKDRKCVIESARCQVMIDGVGTSLELLRGGAAKGRRLSEKVFLEDVRKCLEKVWTPD